MSKNIIGGIITVVLGGTAFTLSQADIVDHFSEETGMNRQEATQYVESAQNQLGSFSDIGSSFIEDGGYATSTAQSLDCTNYTYEWESPGLSCAQGKLQLQTVGINEVVLGNCYKALDTDLGDKARAKIRECIRDIDALNANYDLPVVTELLDGNAVAELRNTNIYNKSALQASLEQN
jgi:hypothetical protein